MDYFDWVEFLRKALPQIKDEVIFEIAEKIETETKFSNEDAYQSGYDFGYQKGANDF